MNGRLFGVVLLSQILFCVICNAQQAPSDMPANVAPTSPTAGTLSPAPITPGPAAMVIPSKPATPPASTTAVTLPPSMSPDVNFLEPYVFDVRPGRRNPFEPPVSVDTSAANPMLPGSPLERYDLDEIKLVGIMWNVTHPKAMFVDPQGKVYVLSRDDRIGRKHGYIAAIRDGEVVVVEASTFNGQNTYSTRVLHIEKAN